MAVGVAALVVVGLGVALAARGDGSDDAAPRPAAERRDASDTTEQPTTTDQLFRAPTPEDYSINVVVLSKECFGSAGCNVTYTVELTINSVLIDPAKTYQVIYEIRGGDEQQIKNLQVTGASYEYESESFISTATEDAALTAVVTSVREP